MHRISCVPFLSLLSAHLRHFSHPYPPILASHHPCPLRSSSSFQSFPSIKLHAPHAPRVHHDPTGQETHIQSTELGNLQAFFKYTLYDGVDCLIALKLLEQNITITPENVDTFKKNLFGQNVQLEASESNKQ